MARSADITAGLNFGAFAKASELKKRILFTLGMLVIYRLGTYIPLPGIDPQVIQDIMDQQSGGLLDVFNVFSGGALGRMSIFTLNVIPYISASIIMQLGQAVVPQLEEWKKEGESGRKKINQYTRYLTVFLAALQAYGLAASLEAGGAVFDPGVFFRASTVITIVGGTMFLLWLGEQITARGVGNGISLIIFSGIVANLPTALMQVLEQGRTGNISPLFIFVLGVVVLTAITVIVFIERAQRRIIIQYPKRQVGTRMFGGESSHLPLKINTAGVIPVIFATSLLLAPQTVAGFSGGAAVGPVLTFISSYLGRGQPLYYLLYGGLVVFFAYFYTAIVFNPEDTAENLKRHGGFIPGIRPGRNTAEYLDYVLTRLTTIGAIYLMIISLAPEYLINTFSLSFLFGGTSMLIVVSVTLDTVAQIQSHLLAHQYEGLIKKSRLKGRNR